jgi:formamidopyrimidine-DNA glycosylase
MPELPDVEHYRRFFAEHGAGRTVSAVWADPTIVRNATSRGLSAALRGHRFEEPTRHGKWLTAWTDGPALLLHFGMTGDLVWSGDEPDRHRHDRLILEFAEGGELRYRNMRKLGGVWLALDRAEADAILGPLGPDALGLNRRRLLELLATRRGGLKAALMDQTLLAGIGNLLADEILWQARLHPRRTIDSLSGEELSELVRSIRRVVRESIEDDDISRKRSWLSPVRGRRDAACPRCGTPLARAVVAGRTTYFCPHCQQAPRPRPGRPTSSARGTMPRR